MSDLARYLSAARALLQLHVRTVASSVQMSDKTITQLEREADRDDPRVERLLQFYGDLGISFGINGDNEIYTVGLTAAASPLTITFEGFANPGEQLNKLQHSLRHIRGLVFKPYLKSTTTAPEADTVSIYIPHETKELVERILAKWISTEGPLRVIGSGGSIVEMAKQDISTILG